MIETEGYPCCVHCGTNCPYKDTGHNWPCDDGCDA
jgi:hypothetical protein